MNIHFFLHAFFYDYTHNPLGFLSQLRRGSHDIVFTAESSNQYRAVVARQARILSIIIASFTTISHVAVCYLDA